MTEDAQGASRTLNLLVGRRLGQLGVGVGQVNLAFEGDHYIALEGAIEVGGHRASRPQDLDGLALLLPLLNHDVEAATVEASGRLLLTVGESTLACGPDEQYEAWNYAGPNGALVVCLPGEGVAVWSSR